MSRIERQAAAAVLRAYVARLDEVNCMGAHDGPSWCGNPRPHVARTGKTVRAGEDECVEFAEAIIAEAEAIESGQESALWPPIGGTR